MEKGSEKHNRKKRKTKEMKQKKLFFLISVNVLGKVNGSNFHIIS